MPKIKYSVPLDQAQRRRILQLFDSTPHDKDCRLTITSTVQDASRVLTDVLPDAIEGEVVKDD